MVILPFTILAAFAFPPADTLDAEALILHFDEPAEEMAEILERLDELRRRPLDLNTCSADDLLDLPFVSAAEARAIIGHRRARGPFPAIDSLGSVEGLDALTLERMLPFVTATSPAPLRRRPPLRLELIQRWTRRLELADGFRRDSSGYLGGPGVVQTRFRMNVGKLSVRATFDKDAGEPMSWNERSRSLGYDFAAAHLQLENTGWVRRIVVGDFSPRFAHGMLLRAPGNVRGVLSSRHGGAASLRPYASAAETGHFRGVGIELAPTARFGLTAFASRRRVDAGIDTTSVQDFPVISRKPSGLHRTPSERAARGALQESIVGGALRTFIGPIAFAGIFFVAEERILAPIEFFRAPGTDRRPLRRRLSASSLSAGGSWGRLYFAAEWAPTAGFSTALGLRASRDSRVGFAVRQGRRAAYLPASALATGSDGFTHIKSDLALHGRHRISRATHVEFELRHAFQRSPTQRAPFASISSAADVLFRYTPKPWITLTFRGTQRHSEDVDACSAIKCMGSSRRHSLRFQTDYRHSRHLENRIRAEFVRVDTKHSATHRPRRDAAPLEGSGGVLLYDELRIRPTQTFLIVARLAVFSADQHAARIYTYERDLLYAFSSPSFAGRGRRGYAFVRWRAGKKASLEAKWSATTFEDVDAIGTGRDKIEGNRIREIRIQIRLNF